MAINMYLLNITRQYRNFGTWEGFRRDKESKLHKDV